MRRTPNRPDRAGFTLVELLVVITIIAILFALTSAAVVKALQKGDEVRVRSEISQLANAVQAYKTQFAVPYLPSSFTIRAQYTTADPDLLYLKTVWPRLALTAVGANVAVSNWGALAPLATAAGTTLNGSHTLVIFLGGPDGVSGFSTSPTDPFGTTGGRVGPFYEFPPDRLAGTPLQFKDVFGSPYLYFSSQRAGNDYPVTGVATFTVVGATVTTSAGTYTVYPYQLGGPAPTTASAATRTWANKSGFQIISAGKNSVFNNGGLNWPGVSGNSVNNADAYFNVANFYPTLLGIAPN